MSIPENILRVKEDMAAAALAAHRPCSEIQLLAVSKNQPEDAIIAAYRAGLTHFAENYLQEAQTKIQALANLPLTWHFIGPIQSNKTKLIARHFAWVHSICRANIAQGLNDARLPNQPKLNVCIQVNLENESGKAGVKKEDVLIWPCS